MFWQFMDAITDGFIDLADYIWDIFEATGGVATIVTLTIIGMFVSFVILNHSGVLSKVGRGSDRVRKRGD